MGRYKSCAGTAEGVEDTVTAICYVPNGVGDQCDWFDCRVKRDFFHAFGFKGVHTGV